MRDDFGVVRSTHIKALEAIPSTTRTQLASQGVTVDVCDDLFQSFGWRAVSDPTTFSGVTGRFTGSATRVATAQPQTTASLIEGKTMLHEIGHALDVCFLAAVGSPNGITPAAPGYTNASGLTGAISNEKALVDLFTPVKNAGVYYRSTVTEWIAQIAMLYWAPQISGFTATSHRNTLIDEVTNNNVSLYNSVVSYMQGIGAFL